MSADNAKPPDLPASAWLADARRKLTDLLQAPNPDIHDLGHIMHAFLAACEWMHREFNDARWKASNADRIAGKTARESAETKLRQITYEERLDIVESLIRVEDEDEDGLPLSQARSLPTPTPEPAAPPLTALERVDGSTRSHAGRQRREKSWACDKWLQETLGNRPVLFNDVLMRGEKAGFSESQLRRSKDAIGAKVKRHGFGKGGQSWWYLGPDATIDDDSGPASETIDDDSGPASETIDPEINAASEAIDLNSEPIDPNSEPASTTIDSDAKPAKRLTKRERETLARKEKWEEEMRKLDAALDEERKKGANYHVGGHPGPWQ